MRLGDKLVMTRAHAGPAMAPPPSPLTEALTRLSRQVRAMPAPLTRPSRGRRDHMFEPESHPLFCHDGPAPSLSEALPGAAVSTPSGHSTWVATSRHPLAGLRAGLAKETALDCSHLERLTGDLRLAGFDVGRALFLDIEATGLEHGAGTLAFMIGLGHVDGDDVVVSQLVLRDPDEERAQLELLWELVDAFPYLVSFNGKSFDLSVLTNRLVMNRLCTPREGELKLRPHLDLLHVSRSLYRGAFEDTRLQTLERTLLGFARVDDVPGALAPSCWFHWLREGDPRPLAGIAEHNTQDVLSMVALTHAVAAVSRPEGDASRPTSLFVNLARTYLRRREPEMALSVLEQRPPLLDPAQLDEALALEVTAARRTGSLQRMREALAVLVQRHPDELAWRRALERADKRLARSAKDAKCREVTAAPEPVLQPRCARPSAAPEPVLQPRSARPSAKGEVVAG